MPKYLKISTFFIVWPAILEPNRSFPKAISLLLCVLIDSLLTLHQSCMPWTSLLTSFKNIGVLSEPTIAVSPGKTLISVTSLIIEISLIYIKNNKGPKTEPWTTSIFSKDEFMVPSVTFCILLIK